MKVYDFKRKDGTVTYKNINSKCIELSEIITERGSGKKVMTMFLNHIVKTRPNINCILLHASDAYGVPVEKLIRFYNSFGFVAITPILVDDNDGSNYVKMRKQIVR